MTGPAGQRHRLALLAALALAGPRGLNRDKAAGLLWPERAPDSARHLLNQAVYAVRKALGDNVIRSVGDDIFLNGQDVRVDALEVDAASRAGLHGTVVDLCSGPFLDGFSLPDAQEFDHWVERTRTRFDAMCAASLEALAEDAASSGNFTLAVDWWRARAAHDPYDSRVALRLMQAFERNGNRGGALTFALAHERVLRDEVGTEPPPEVLEFVRRLRGQHESTAASPAALPPPPRTLAMRVAVPQGRRGARIPTQRWWRSPWSGVVALGTGGLVWAVVTSAPPTTTAATDATRATGRPPGTASVAARDSYLRASDPALLRSDTGAREALELLRRAAAADPGFAAAWAGVARLSMRVSFDVPGPEREALRGEASRAAAKAVSLDGSLPEAHATLGLLRMLAFDFVSAEQDLARAARIRPDAVPHEWMVSLRLWTGEPVKALQEAEEALRLDPLSPAAHAEVARALVVNGRPDDALAHLRLVAGVHPPLLRAAIITAQCYAAKGMWRDAIETLRPAVERGQRHTAGLYGYLLARAGDRAEAARVLRRLREDGGGDAFEVALVHAGLGEHDVAVAWLDRAVVDGSLSGSPEHVVIMGPLFDDLRARPAFARLRERLRRRAGD